MKGLEDKLLELQRLYDRLKEGTPAREGSGTGGEAAEAPQRKIKKERKR